ncbi:sulfurtransferase [candidate division WOR-3 bacterium]|nr:sulfurtransferase [candidate division WOR-3 bacterium]
MGGGVLKWTHSSWLGENLGGKFSILDVQPDIHDYILEHIPGSVYFNPNLLRVPYKGLPGVYVPEKIAELLFRRVGLSNDYPVVVYTGVGGVKGWGDGLEQTMVAYSLLRFGHNKVYVLDGGLNDWKKEGRKLTKEFPIIEESDFKVKLREDYWIGYEDFKRVKDNKDVILLDARPANVYEGQGPWIKPGHIPGAVNLPWKSLMVDDNPALLKGKDEINSILEEKRIGADKTIICSCGTGREATNEFIMFKFLLEYPNVKIYEGSFTEWSSYPENPTVTGKNPR